MASAALPHEEEPEPQPSTNSAAEAAERKSKGDWILGIFFIFLVCLLWATSSVIVQFVADDIGYNQPFVFTFIGSGIITTLVPSYLGLSLLGLTQNPPLWDEPGADDGVAYKELEATSDGDDRCDAGATIQEQPNPGNEAAENRLLDTGGSVNGSRRNNREVLTSTSVVVSGSEPARKPLKSHFFMFKISLSMSVVWYFAQWSYTTSLGYTSMTSSTIISNSGALFAYLFNVAARTERFTKTKTAGVFLALLGAVTVGLCDKGDDNASQDSLWGDASALASAVLYGVYSTILTLKSPSADEVSMSLVLGYMGFANLLIFLPFLVGLALVPGMRVLQGLTFHIVQLIVLKSVLDNLFSELLWARAILLTTPTVATVGCSLTIPIAFASDFLLHGNVPKALAVLGATLVVGGFYFVSGREDSGGGHGGGGGGGGGCRGGYASACCARRMGCLRRQRPKPDA